MRRRSSASKGRFGDSRTRRVLKHPRAPASNQSPQSVIPCGSAAQGTRRSGSGAPFANRRSCMTGAIDTCDIMVAPVQRGESQIRTSARVAQAVDVCLDVPLAKAAFCCPSATNSAARVPRLLRTACNLDVSRQNLCESLAFTFGTCVYFRTRRKIFRGGFTGGEG